MKREMLKNHSMVSSVLPSCLTRPVMEELLESEVARLLRLVYTDPDGHINGDIAAYLGEKTSPELREYIRQNILYDVQPSDVSLPADDATIEMFIRDEHESSFDYRDRVRGLLEQYGNDFKDLSKKLKEQKEQKDG